MPRSSSLTQTIIRHPIIWGGLLSLAFYAPIRRGWITNELVHRYFNSHPVEHVIVVLYFVGIAALAIKALDHLFQREALGRLPTLPASNGQQDVADAGDILQELATEPKWFQNSYIGQRLHDALSFVKRKKSADTLDEHMRHLGDVDADRMHNSYALSRIVIWAIPILGFLGTVVGITLAISELKVAAIDEVTEVTSGLSVAFDTTALALSLSIVLMFLKYFLERQETHLLTAVDDLTAGLLVGRFQEQGTAQDPNVATIRHIAQTILEATETLIQRQTELWQETIDQAHQRWSHLTDSSGEQLAGALSEALGQSLGEHARAITDGEERLSTENHRHWDNVQNALAQTAQVMADQQSELVHQGDVLRQVVEATGQIKRLEMALNENLQSLSGSHNFEETVISLSAAIQLLTARLESPGDRHRVDLEPDKSIGNAA